MLKAVGLVLALWVLVLSGQIGAQPVRNTEPFHSGVTDAASLERQVAQGLERSKALLTRLLAVSGPRTVENTLAPFDELVEQVENARGLARAMELHPDAAVRTVATRLRLSVINLWQQVSLRRDVFDALAGIDRTQIGDPQTAHYLERTLQEFRRDGVELPDPERIALQHAFEQLTAAAAEFDRNISDGTGTVRATAAELEGVPRDFLARLKREADGSVTLRTTGADVDTVLTFARDPGLRRRAYVAWRNVAYPQNQEVLQRMLELRETIASKLGFQNWAEYNAASRMTGTARAVSSFLDDVTRASERKASAEYRDLLDRKRRDEPTAASLWDWELPYYTNLVKQERYEVDAQRVRQYFAFDRVVPAVLDLASRMYGVTFREVTVPTWHASVRAYELVEDGRLVGRFYLDLHPRPNKGGTGASMRGVRAGSPRQTPEAIIIAALSGGVQGDPGLMGLNEVRTLFHEFGHLVHFLTASRSRWYGLNGLPTESDVVEAPSTMLEEWMTDANVLQTFARHYQTNEVIPDALVAEAVRANEFGKALAARRAANLSAIALTLHTRPATGMDTHAVFLELSTRHLPYGQTAETHMEAGWTHLGNPLYTSAYYTYLWSQVIAKDLFTQFDRSDLLAPGPARRYRELILAPGSAKPAARLIQDFLGRPFRIDAWEQWLNDEGWAPAPRQ